MDTIVPEEMSEAVDTIVSELISLEKYLEMLLHLIYQEQTPLSPLQQASAFIALSKSVNVLFSLHLRCKGLSQRGQMLSSEVERVNLYEEKVGCYMKILEAPKFPSANLDVEAANRFIEHSITDLSEDQKKDLRSLKKVDRQRRKCRDQNFNGFPEEDERQAARTQSIKEAAEQFLRVAKEEIRQAKAEVEEKLENLENTE